MSFFLSHPHFCLLTLESLNLLPESSCLTNAFSLSLFLCLSFSLEGKIEVKILTRKNVEEADDQWLTEEDTKSFRELLINLLVTAKLSYLYYNISSRVSSHTAPCVCLVFCLDCKLKPVQTRKVRKPTPVVLKYLDRYLCGVLSVLNTKTSQVCCI